MTLKSSALISCIVFLLGLGQIRLPVVHAEPTLSQAAGDSQVDPTAIEERATQIVAKYCALCHGTNKQKSGVRLDALETIDPFDRQKLMAKVQDVVNLGEMPPEDAKQPAAAERKILLQWLGSQLTGKAARALEEKLQRFEYGNVVNHHDLFSGKYADLPGYTLDRRWLISEFIFNEKVNRLIDYQPTRRIYGQVHPVAGDSGVHWSPKTERGYKFRMAFANPFLLPKNTGVRYSAHEPVTAGHLLTMIGNAKRIAGHMVSASTMKSRYPAAYSLMEMELKHRDVLRSRQQFLTTYSYMEHLLKDIYGDGNDALLPKLQRTEAPYPGAVMKNGKPQKRNDNLGFLPRLNAEDVDAIFHGIATYKKDDLTFKEVVAEGQTSWGPYTGMQREAFDEILLKSERDWAMEGVTQYRIENRLTTAKIFFDQWDMNALLQHIKSKAYGPPAFKPLSDAEMEVIISTIKTQREKGDTYLEIIDRCMATWDANFRAEREAAGAVDEQRLGDVVDELTRKVFQRDPTPAEREKRIALMKVYLSKLETQQAIAKLIESLLLDTQFVYRHEFGQGEADEHGRRMMSPREASYALAYALTDSSPDAELVKAVEAGRLQSREDYEREVRRMLQRRDKWSVIDEAVQAANLNASVTNQPVRKLRFFREFFGYPKAQQVFKDDSRFGAGRHEQAVSRLIDEADMLVEHILQQDKHVFEQLLTTDKYYIYHSGDNQAMQAASQQLKRVYDYFKDLDWKTWQPEDIAPHKSFMLTIWEFRKVRGGDNKSLLKTLQRMMAALELHFSEGQQGAMPYMKMAMGFWHGGPVVGRTGQQMRGEQVTSYFNIDWRTWDYPARQPAKIANRKGILTHPAWLIAHAQNLETDPIHRGKWIREKLLAGTIPDVPITVDAVIPPDHNKTLRQRMEARTGDAYCWRCHQKMDPLGFPFESYDDFGRYRTHENLEHPDNLLTPADKAPLTYGAKLPVYKTLPVDPRGVLKGTGDKELDGEVKDAFDLIDRLAKSRKVRQSIIRHAFRYFMGRNETLSDSKTLIDAEKAYMENEGSFDEVIVSLLTSDSFIYRKQRTARE